MNTISQALMQHLLSKQMITEDQYEIILKQDPNNLTDTEQRIIELGSISKSQIQTELQHLQQREYIELQHVLVDSDALNMVSENLAKKALIFPISYDGQNELFKIATCERTNHILLNQLQSKLGANLKWQMCIATESDLQNSIDKYYGYELSLDGIFRELENTTEISAAQNNDEASHPIVRLVNAILIDAVKKRSSDIHFEPDQYFVRIRYRIDGVMKQIRLIHIQYWQAIVIRLKVICGMDIAETRAAQDGRLQMQILAKNIDFRVASHPTIYGENIVLRILDRDKVAISLNKIQLRDSLRNQLFQLLKKTHGLVLVSGPTGSGKTTMLHAMVNHLNSSQVNIMTLEDPVEYQLAMVRQTSLTELNKLDFASGIRSILRQDPDIILVGEIRDEETAKMAFRAAMTGHLVFSTLHANSILGVIPRLKDMGLSTETIIENLNGVIAQRLVRMLCECKQADKQHISFISQQLNCSVDCIYRPMGCDKCLQTGYFGRMLIIEYLEINAHVKKLLAKHSDSAQLSVLVQQLEITSMWQDGLRRVAEGFTTLEEVMRVVNIDQELQTHAQLSF